MDVCSTCGEEVRWGQREGGQRGYLHREEVDHMPTFGPKTSPERYMEILAGHRAFTVNKEAERKDHEDEEGSDVIEPVEVPCTPIPLPLLKVRTPTGGTTKTGKPAMATSYAARIEPAPGFELDIAIPGGVNTTLSAAAAAGWEVRRLTYSRGPFLSSSGKSLGVSDFVVIGLAGPMVDGGRVYGVASWRDGKSYFGWWINADRSVEHLGAEALKARMKENPCG